MERFKQVRDPRALSSSKDARPAPGKPARELAGVFRLGTGWHEHQSFLLSLSLHVIALTALGVTWTSTLGGNGALPEQPIGIAIVENVSEGESYFVAAPGANSEGGSGEAGSASTDALPSGSDAPVDSDSVLVGLLPSESGAGGAAGQATGGTGLGDGGNSLGGGGLQAPKVKTSVFGIEGTGSRFVYVFDRSDSMNGYSGLPFKTAKGELLTSLNSLGKLHQFQVIFYNDAPLPFTGNNGGVKLLFGTDENKAEASSFVQKIPATGGTQHVEALRMALAMGPDVVYFLTDAAEPPLANQQLDNLQLRASRTPTTIHTIQFGAGHNQFTDGWIARLARMTGGQYRYVDVTKFQRDSVQ